MKPSPREHRSGICAVLLLAGFTIFFYRKILFTNRFMFPWDAADFFYPYFSFVHVPKFAPATIAPITTMQNICDLYRISERTPTLAGVLS